MACEGYKKEKRVVREESEESYYSLMKFCCEGDKTPQFINSLSQNKQTNKQTNSLSQDHYPQ